MLYQLHDCTVSFGPRTVLDHIEFMIKGGEKAALVGRNGAGKTTLLKLLAGEITPDRDDKRHGPAVLRSRDISIGMLQQTPWQDGSRTVEEELLASCPVSSAWDTERYRYETEYDRFLTGFGFRMEDKKKRIAEFSGGEQTKLAMISLLLKKPDLLLLDEPTNHLDTESAEWLEAYLRDYPKAVVMVSHDRFFLDRTADTVYELSGGKLNRYPGNYTNYRAEKEKKIRIGRKRYLQQQEEIAHLKELIERFRNKPTKAAMTRAKKKILERMVPVPDPEQDEAHIFTGRIVPEFPGPKRVWEGEHLQVGYDRPLYELSLKITRGQKIALMGPNGSGKTTLLKTISGLLPAFAGSSTLGEKVTVGYFDQHSAELTSDLSVAEHYHALYPVLTEKEVRSELGNYLFGGREAQKKVSALSGGEKARLVLAEILKAAPSFLVLDEPTNHMDIPAKETLESAFRSYAGTMIFVSHDRYFVSRVAQSLLLLEADGVMYYPFGYRHYLDHVRYAETGSALSARISAESEALIAGIRAVPKAERHRLREVPTETAYADWKLQLAAEQCTACRTDYERALEELLQACDAPAPVYTDALNHAAGALDRWTAALIEADVLRQQFGMPDSHTAAEETDVLHRQPGTADSYTAAEETDVLHRQPGTADSYTAAEETDVLHRQPGTADSRPAAVETAAAQKSAP